MAVESKLHITVSNVFDLIGTPTITPAVEAETPEANILDSQRGKIVRITGSPDPVIKGSSATVHSIGCSSMWGHNFDDATTLRWRYWDGENQSGSVAYDSGASLVSAQDETSYDNSPTSEGTFAGGTGHAVSDILTMSDGSQVTVDAVSTGVITQFTVDSTTATSDVSEGVVVTQSSTTGSGIDFTLTPDIDNTIASTPALIVSPWGSMVPGVDPWGDVYSIGAPPLFVDYFDNIQFKSYQIDINNVTPLTSLDIGLIYGGLTWSPSANFSWGSAITRVDSSKHTRTEGGGLRTESSADYRQINFDLDWLSEDDQDRLMHLLHNFGGKANDILMSLDPTITTRMKLEGSMLCRRVNDTSFSRLNFAQRSAPLVFEEI